MDFAFSESQREWYDAAIKFAREQLADPDAARREALGEFWREGYRRCAAFGVQGLPVPVEYGGRGQDLLTTAAAMEGLGYACPDTGLVFAMGASLWTMTMPILAFGTEAQKRRYLPGLCDGTPAGGQCRQRARSRLRHLLDADARRATEQGWVLNGRKAWITSALDRRPLRLLRQHRSVQGRAWGSRRF